MKEFYIYSLLIGVLIGLTALVVGLWELKKTKAKEV